MRVDTIGALGCMAAVGLVIGVFAGQIMAGAKLNPDLAAWVQAVGSVMAIGAAIWIGCREHARAITLMQAEDERRTKAEMDKRRSVAKAVLREMMQAVNQLAAAQRVLDEASRYATDYHPVLTRAQLQHIRPFARRLWMSMGDSLSSLSEHALSHAVAFDGTTQMLERTFDMEVRSDLGGQAPITVCKLLAIKVRDYLFAIEPNLLAVAEDAEEIGGQELEGILATLRSAK